MQTRKHSLIESCLDTCSGILVAFMGGWFIYPILNIHVSNRDNMIVVLFFTIISIGRKYIWRRVFNRYTDRVSING